MRTDTGAAGAAVIESFASFTFHLQPPSRVLNVAVAARSSVRHFVRVVPRATQVPAGQVTTVVPPPLPTVTVSSALGSIQSDAAATRNEPSS
jgi:hypothetical protein